MARIALVLLAVVSAPTLCSGAAAQMLSPRTVVVIHWGPEEFPAAPTVIAAIREVLTADSERPVDVFTEYLESDLFPPEQASLALADYIRGKYRGRRIDLVIAIADPALRFVLEHRVDLFPGAPVVYSGVAIPEGTSRSADGGLTAVLRGVAYAETLNLALSLHASTEDVFVVALGSDRQAMDSVRAELEGFEQRVRLTYLATPTIAQMVSAIRAVPRRSLVLYIWFTQRDSGQVLLAKDAAPLLTRASPVPVYGTNDGYIGSGVVGGVVRDTRETAVRVAVMAREILNGTRPEDIPVEDARLVPIFDWRQIQRWGIDPARLPPGSGIRFRVPTLWESYRAYIIGVFIVMAAQLLLIGGLLTQRARRRRAEETVRTREATLRTSYERIRQLAGRLINAQEAARAQIARDLHDDVCQQLVGVSMDVSRLERASGRIQDLHAQHALSNLRQRALAIVNSVRQLSHDLHPATLQLVGLAAALESQCIEVERRYDVQVSSRVEGDLTQLHADVALCLFRIVQEALRNGAAHGGARRLAVSVVRAGRHIDLTITDDGHGFDLDAARQESRGLGLLSMEERAHMIGGEVHITTAVGRGTTVRVRVPIAGERDAESDRVRVHVHAFTVDASEPSERI
jgi:signal transduction histidine kinase